MAPAAFPVCGVRGWGCGFVCFWFPGCTDHAWWLFLWGRLVCGVCGTGLLFENYIVDASIFYKKQFPRYMNLDLCCCSCVVPFGVRRWGWWCGFRGSLERIAFY